MPIILKPKQFEILCAKKNLSQETLSRRLKISLSYISMLKNYAKYKKTPSVTLRKKIIKLLSTDYFTLFTYKPPKNKKQMRN